MAVNFRSAGAVVLIAVVIVLVGGSMVADRLGAPADLVATLALLLAVAGLTLAGFSARSMKPSEFYLAGRNLPAVAVLALVLTLLLALGAPPATEPGVLDLERLAAGCAGLLLFSLVAAGPLRRIGGYTFADAMSARFGSPLLSAVAALLSCCILAALALWLGPMAAAAVQSISGLKLEAARLAVLVLGAAIIFPGGLGGIAAAALLSAALAALAWTAPALPAWFAEASDRAIWLEQTAATLASASAPKPDWPLLAFAAAGLFVVLNPSAAGRDVKTPGRIGGYAVIAAGVIALFGLFAHEVARQRIATIETASAQTLPSMLFSDQFRSIVRICGSEPTTPDDMKRICARTDHTGPQPRPAVEIIARGGRWHAAILGVPSVAGEAFGLATPFLLLVALAYACHAAAAALTHDLLRRFVLPPATAGGDLALQRMAGLLTLAGAVYASGHLPAPDERLLPALLFAAACVPLPLVMLARWRRADWRAALCGLASALVAGVTLWLGLLDGPAGALAGVGCALVAGLVAALIFPAGPGDARAVAVLEGAAPGPLVLERSA